MRALRGVPVWLCLALGSAIAQPAPTSDADQLDSIVFV